jgi:protein-tyrosine phosphatase
LHRDFFYGTAFAFTAAGLGKLALQSSWYSAFVWPAISLGVVSLTYLLGEVRLFGKRSDGTRHWFATVILFPYLAFAHIVWLMQTVFSNEPCLNVVNESLIVARRLRTREFPTNVRNVCDLTCEFVEPEWIRTNYVYICHPILDAGTVSATELIALAKSLVPDSKGPLLIHCANGHGRTGMFAAIWLVVHGFVDSADDAFKLLQSVRPGIGLRSRQRRVVLDAVAELSAPSNSQ